MLDDVPDVNAEDDESDTEMKTEIVKATAEALGADEAPAKANGHAKPKVKKAKGKASAPKMKAKGAKKAATKPAKAKVKRAAGQPRTVDPAKLDQWGFRKGSIKSQAAAMYAAGKGATLAEVAAQLGSVQYNVLNELEAKGFTVSEKKEDGAGKRGVTRYKLTK